MKDFNDWMHDNIISKNIKNIGLELSGGVDSAYILFLLCKFFITNKTSHRILPIHGFDEKRKYANSIAAAQAVIDVIKKRVPNAPIDNMFIFKYHAKPKENKMPLYHRPVIRSLLDEKRIDMNIRGYTREPEYNILKKNNMESIGRLPSQERWERSPLSLYTKRDIADLYRKNNLMEDLFPVTISCTDDRKDLKPCKKCWWCKEKYDAFGMYDGKHT